ncbi:bifunctional NMN adenylyltransferase/nudix hydrolase [Brevundimonas phage vB_BpoS-Domovoi]|uniref:Bifunctional NMN adenylyltransferase/nudix hydrolase n=1 Tax=Brevundimonas phage vB_BpoS-Domovoi TaxID=2948598 RepID=A0A9E7MR45_9CAUD|nr:bifunctional NMN adenylyltransferase/nudix hydrolase [Brevundimonas phage vB_BpoS-Domovoi]
MTLRGLKKKPDVMVFIGRFQPLHNGHLDVIAQALSAAERLIILVGSANLARDTRNPFTYEERAALIRTAIEQKFGAETADRVVVCPVPDSPYELQEWIETVQMTVKMNTVPFVRPTINLTGHDRDETSFYLKLFPQWPYAGAEGATDLNASALRADYFNGGVDLFKNAWRDSGPVWPAVAPPATLAFLQAFRDRPEYARLMRELKAERAYKAKYGPGPHVTLDAVVIQSGHVLVGRRKGEYGHGMLALPGGFLEVKRNETLLEGAERECFEETGLFNHFGPDNLITDERRRMLHTHLRGTDVFGDPNRSRRGRLITHAHLFKLPDDYTLPPVEPWDDLEDVHWMPISDVRADEFFEDHAFIIEKMIRQFL